MRRFLFAAALVLMLGLVAYAQRPLNATSQGNLNTYNPLVFGAVPTPTNTPTPPVPTVTATLVPEGTGVFKKEGSTIYGGRDDQKNISACGFVRFWDGTPAYGGPEGFGARACLDATGNCLYTSPQVDASGYYEIPIEAFMEIPADGGGSIYVTKGTGNDREQVSQNFRFEFEDVEGDPVGLVIRMDFRECRVGDSDPRCSLEQAAVVNGDGSYLVEVPFTDDSPRSPNDYCPNPQ